ncbi:hypothetical protein COU80_04920 [Candidatus Peregrinibacteria bacterium CG10_big_fil_rev_8_21_14_0_10_55_24]|nr:MAG: hypothetical protein COU80_04920 [Candidatus Peregrinibacteria bacterium CG10_big_fil_rev_8_21_14_0_10_55_24]
MRTRSLFITSGVILLTCNLSVAVLEYSVAEPRASATTPTTIRASVSAPQNPRKRPQTVPVVHGSSKPAQTIAPVLIATKEREPQAKPTLLEAVDHTDIRAHHQEIANEVLRALPTQCLSALKRLYVRYDNPDQRGLAGKNSIILDGSVPDSEFRALLIHEFGHITDLGCLTGANASAPSGFRDGTETIYANDPSVGFYQISWTSSRTKVSGTQDEDFVSGYASWDPFEDFAETFAYYVLQRDAFAMRAEENTALAEKFAWMETHIFQQDTAVATGTHRWTGTVPWDVTKLGYAWLASR